MNAAEIPTPSGSLRVFAPGRVNLIGEHTDYTGGMVLPMAIDLGTTFEGERTGRTLHLRSSDVEGALVLPLEVPDPAGVEPAWGRYVAGVVSVVRPTMAITGTISTTLPIGAGLSSSAALEVAIALALGFEGPVVELALACQRAEQLASGVPCGVMDQLASAGGIDGHALMIDYGTLEMTPVAVPPNLDIVVVHSGESRALGDSHYAQRRAECEEAASIIGPLSSATPEDAAELANPVLRARARHVTTENRRVREFAAAMVDGDLELCGRLMAASHRSLARDFEVSTPRLDALVERLRSLPGVYGARLTGAGFGGCVVALSEPDALAEGWHVRPSAGARKI
jgi:galactokinase